MAAARDPSFKRARSPQKKEQRRANILATARELAVRNGVRNVTLTRIAEEVGLAPSNVLANFGTREEIYLHILGDAWNDWTDELDRTLAGQPSEAATVASAITAALRAEPLFCDLAASIAPSYEDNASVDAILRISRIGRDNAIRYVALITAALPLTADDALQLLHATFSLTHYWWRRSHPSAAAVRAREEEPREVAHIDFETEMRRMLGTYIAGLLAQPLAPDHEPPKPEKR